MGCCSVASPVLVPVPNRDYDVLDVFLNADRIGQLCAMADGWAVYRANPHTGSIVTGRIGTYNTIYEGVKALA